MIKYSCFGNTSLLSLLIWISGWQISCAQAITKEEILLRAKTEQVAPNMDSLFRWEVHAQTRKTFDDLRSDGVDSLVVYSVSHPNMWVGPKDSCTTMYSVYSYFFWVKNGIHRFRKVDGKSESKQLSANDKVIRFAENNYSRIKEEFFMGAIYVHEWKGKLQVTETIVDHEPKYSILIVLGEQYKYLRFTQYGLDSKESLFTDYNKQLVSFKLFELIESEIVGN